MAKSHKHGKVSCTRKHKKGSKRGTKKHRGTKKRYSGGQFPMTMGRA